MSAAVALFVFRVSIPFCKNVGFLAISFSMIYIMCWSVSMTSTISASDLLKFFHFFGFHGLWLVNLLCASASIEHVRQDLELITVVQHCPYLVDLR